VLLCDYYNHRQYRSVRFLLRLSDRSAARWRINIQHCAQPRLSPIPLLLLLLLRAASNGFTSSNDVPLHIISTGRATSQEAVSAPQLPTADLGKLYHCFPAGRPSLFVQPRNGSAIVVLLFSGSRHFSRISFAGIVENFLLCISVISVSFVLCVKI